MRGSGTSAVTLRKVGFCFEPPRQIVFIDNLDIEYGEIVSIMGPSGCGKTTLLRLLAKLLTPTEGTLTVATDRIAFLYQNDGLLPWFDIWTNVALPGKIGGFARAEHESLVTELLDNVNILDAAKRFPHQLSGGMRKRAELARVLASRAGIWLLDEPFESLDPVARQRMLQLLKFHQRAKAAAVVMVTHSLDDAALIADKLVVLNGLGGIAGAVIRKSPSSSGLRKRTDVDYRTLIQNATELLCIS